VTTSSRNPVAVEDRTARRDYRFATNRADAGFGPNGWAPGAWTDRSRIVLTPVAAPSILGLYGLFAATLIIGANMAGWWGSPTSPVLVFPLIMMLGGLAQFTAGVWAYRARDGLATALHGIWGAFWLAFGLYQLLAATGVLPLPTQSRAAAVDFGMWFVPLTAITAAMTVAAAAASIGLVTVLASLTAGSLFAALGFMGAQSWSITLAGWLFFISACLAWYVASAMLIEGEHGRTVLPTGRRSPAGELPERQTAEPVG
jgi:succinate-acetate transporter protein